VTDRSDAVFAALADPTRRGLLETVAERGPLSATDLARDRPITRQAVAKHLDVLSSAGLIERRRAGRETLYEARTTALGEVVRWIEVVDRCWDRRLSRLRDQLGTGDD
jgi:DNA-binding transcriptional ArsR family regulator